MDEDLHHFMAVTGSSLDEARRMIEACAGNLEMAVTMHLECAGNRPGGSAQRPQAGPGSSSSSSLLPTATGNPTSYEEIHGVRAPIPQMQGRLIEQEESMPRRSFRRRNLPRSVFDPFQDFSTLSKSDTDLKGKKRTLAELFRPPVNLMFNGSFQEARSAGTARKKWIMVNLQDSGEFQCQTLNRDLWSNGHVKRMINKHFIFLQIQKITDEAVKFCQLYHTNAYPTIAIIDPRTGEKQVEWGHLTVDDFLAKVQEFLSMNILNNEMLPSSSGESMVYEQSEEAQLEAAIKASLEMNDDQPMATVLSTSDDDDDDVKECRVAVSSITTRSSRAKADSRPVETRVQTRRSAASGRANSSKMGPCMESSAKEQTDYALTNSSDYSSRDEESVLAPVTATGKQGASRKRKLPATRRSKRKRGRLTEVDADEEEEKSSPHAEMLASTATGIIGSTSRLTINDASQRLGIRSMPGHGAGVGGGSNSPLKQEIKKSTGQSGEEAHLLIRFPDGERIAKSFPSNSSIENLFAFLQSSGLHREHYEVVAIFPQRKISSLPSTITFKEAGLFPRHTLFVQLSD